MIRLVNVNKYFNRFKSNQIHAIDNTTLELDNNGLVALLGESGSGKTTLLNVIGGLDKIDDGSIYLNNKKMPNRTSYKKDEMRVLNIGYIFQNFYLLDGMSVFDNVAMSLKTIGIKNKKEIKEKVDYVLNKVGMYRYRNKPAGMLSGGERQRVAIARAIVKNPSIIIADEPTGNLDSKNTIEIMNIIASIAKEKLVILVTHEKNLAFFYADRIISIEDGKIKSDILNETNDDLDYRIDNIFYLKDFKHHNAISEHNNKIDIYSDEAHKLKLSIVVRGDNIYIKSEGTENIEVANENSNIEFLDEHYKKIEKDGVDKYDFDIEKLNNKRVKYSSIYSVSSMIKSGYNTVKKYKPLKKVLLIGFFITAMFIVYAISNIFGSTKISDNDFVAVDKNYIRIKTAQNKISDYVSLKNDANIEYLIPGESMVTLRLISDKFYQFYNSYVTMSTSLVSINKLSRVIAGRMPESKYEIVIDKRVFEKTLEDGFIKMLGIKNEDDLLSYYVELDGIEKFKIVGISDTGNPSVYFDETIIPDVISRGYEEMHYESNYLLSTNVMNSSVKFVEGRMPINDYETIVNIENKEFMPISKEIDYTIGDKKLKVVGYYRTPLVSNVYYVSSNTLTYENLIKYPSLFIYSNNKESTIEYLNSKGYGADDTYIISKNEYIKSKNDSVKESLIIAGILLAVSFIEKYLMVRSSFLSRIKEIGMLRAVGVKRLDIYKMFLGEVLIITTFASIPGYILMSLILKEIIKIEYLKTMFTLDFKVLLISFITIYALNMFMGLLPIFNVIRHSPAKILSRNDID